MALTRTLVQLVHNNFQRVQGQFADGHFAHGQLADRQFADRTVRRQDSSPTGHFADRAVRR